MPIRYTPSFIINRMCSVESALIYLFLLLDSVWLQASAVTQGQEGYWRIAQSNKERAGRRTETGIPQESPQGHADKAESESPEPSPESTECEPE